MASLPVPLLVRCKLFLPRHSLPIVLLSTISSLREFKWLYKFSTVRDALSSSVLLITLEIITLHCGREFWIKVLSLRILCSTTREDLFTQLFVPTCKKIVSGIFVIKVVGSDAYHRLMFQEKGELSQDIFSIIFFHRYLIDIIESPVIKIVFRDHLWIWSLLLSVMTEDGFEGYEAVMSISISEVLGMTFFSGTEILEFMYCWWYWLRTSFIWWSMWTFFFGMAPLVSFC